jgi:glycosyltransferase involved in cell wall biosynthesis
VVQIESSASVAMPGSKQRTRTSVEPGANGRASDASETMTGTQSIPGVSDGRDPIRSISVVIPCHNEEGNLPTLHARLTDVLEQVNLPYEILIVDDGSTDRTWSVIGQLNRADHRVIGLRHRRNFGKAEGLANAFAVARGDVIITMDGDLQDDPDELPNFLAMLDEGYDLVSGWKQRRQDPLGKTFPSRIFNWTVRRASGVQLHDFNCGFKAYRNEVARSLRLYGELHRFTPVLASADGYRIGELPVKHHPRTWGRSKYGWSRLVKGFLDLLTVTFLTQYRQRPMHLFGLPGLSALALGVLLAFWLSADKLITGSSIGNRPALLLAVLLIVIGTQFFALGLLGEFLTHGSNAPRSGIAQQIRASIGLDTAPDLGDSISEADPSTATSPNTGSERDDIPRRA